VAVKGEAGKKTHTLGAQGQDGRDWPTLGFFELLALPDTRLDLEDSRRQVTLRPAVSAVGWRAGQKGLSAWQGKLQLDLTSGTTVLRSEAEGVAPQVAIATSGEADFMQRLAKAKFLGPVADRSKQLESDEGFLELRISDGGRFDADGDGKPDMIVVHAVQDQEIWANESWLVFFAVGGEWQLRCSVPIDHSYN